MRLFSKLFGFAKALLLCKLVIALGVAGWWFVDKESAQKFYAQYVQPRSEELHHRLYDRRVVVLGAKNISKEQISNLLPNDKSNIYWWLNRESIARKVSGIKIIQDTVVNLCNDRWPPSCFSIEVTERTPSYVAVRGSTAVLLDIDGNELDAVPQSELSRKLQELLSVTDHKPKIVVGLYSTNTSSDQVSARFEYVKQAVQKIEDESRIEFSKIELLPSGELLLKPSKANFNVQFDNNWQNLDGLTDQVKRLKLVLNEVSGRLPEVTKIDLAFNRLAVVAYSEAKNTALP